MNWPLQRLKWTDECTLSSHISFQSKQFLFHFKHFPWHHLDFKGTSGESFSLSQNCAVVSIFSELITLNWRTSEILVISRGKIDGSLGWFRLTWDCKAWMIDNWIASTSPGYLTPLWSEESRRMDVKSATSQAFKFSVLNLIAKSTMSLAISMRGWTSLWRQLCNICWQYSRTDTSPAYRIKKWDSLTRRISSVLPFKRFIWSSLSKIWKPGINFAKLIIWVTDAVKLFTIISKIKNIWCWENFQGLSPVECRSLLCALEELNVFAMSDILEYGFFTQWLVFVGVPFGGSSWDWSFGKRDVTQQLIKFFASLDVLLKISLSQRVFFWASWIVRINCSIFICTSSSLVELPLVGDLGDDACCKVPFGLHFLGHLPRRTASLDMPRERHFLSLQYWQRFLLILIIRHSSPFEQTRYLTLCCILLRKKPLQPSQAWTP